ncbi:MAG: rhodanese-like domain-containing protein [Gammaproteobacteria bacterium]|nr:rhodanese-like domain-containing protein [Gammaproteobacteria bacterium]
MIKAKRMATAVLISALALSVNPAVADKPVGITSKMMDAEVVHDGKKVKITRNQNNKNTVNPSFSKTSRPCPPFCVQPAIVAPGVETVGELEVIEYLKKMAAGDDSILVIDSRTPDWVKKGTIPGAVNIPWTKLNPAKGADPLTIGEILQEQFNVKESEGLWNFNDAKTLVMFCNGMWCGQSPNNIENLLKFGYPAHKLKWYRGGMQDWEILGLSTIPGK